MIFIEATTKKKYNWNEYINIIGGNGMKSKWMEWNKNKKTPINDS